MYVSVIHTISEPDPFWAAAEAGLDTPEGVTLHSSYPNGDGSKAVCLWEGPSADAVRDFVDGAAGSYASNEYFEVNAERAQGLPG